MTAQYFQQLFDDPSFCENVPWTVKRFAPGEVIIEEGGKSRCVYFVVDGTVHVQTDIVLDQESTKGVGIAKLSNNEIFGELSMFDDMPHNASVIAATDCQITMIDSGPLSEFLSRNPEHGYRVMRDIVEILVERMRSNNMRSSSIMGWYLRESRVGSPE